MQTSLMKPVGTMLLVVGVVVCAASGVRLGESEFAAAIDDGRGALTVDELPDASTRDAPISADGRLDEWSDIAGLPFAVGLALLIAGAIIARIGIGRDGAADGSAEGADFADGLKRLAAAVAGLHAKLEAPGPDTEQIRHELDTIQREVIEPMIDARSALQARIGLAGCAEVLGPLSGAERLLNRAWSALVDGHLQEGRASVVGAAAEVGAAQEALISHG